MSDPSWGLRPGSEVDPTLAVIGTLGGGSRYEVFHCWDRALFCEVAAKTIRPHRVDDERALSGFEQEAALGSRLVHPNLVRLLRVSRARPRPYLVFEFVRARSVGDHVADHDPVKVPEACLLGIRMCSALHYLHRERVVHLDVKPDNVTMGDPPRLLDLGIARSGPPLRLAHAIGTAAYMSPEQCAKGVVDERTDLFGLGATLYEAVSAMIPFPPGDDAADDGPARYPQLEEPARPLSDAADVPRAFERVVMACLERDPARRPRSAVEVAVALHGVLEALGMTDLYAWPKGTRVAT